MKKKKDLRIGLVELYATNGGSLWDPKMKDLYSLVRLPSRAIELLAAILRQDGFSSVKTYNPNYNRFRGRFHPKELKELAEMDVVGLSAISRTQPPSYELARQLKELNPRIKIIFGGPHVTADPEEAVQYGDIIVRREGDATITELMERLLEDVQDPFLADVQGISYRDRQGECLNNPDRPFISSKALSALPFPEYPLEVRKNITYSMIVTSRGCPFECDFCSVISHFGSQYRFMNVERSVELIEHTLRQTQKPIFFGDDNFHARASRTKAVLEVILKKGLSMPPWGAQVRVEASQDSELLDLMRRAGCTRLYVGFESVNEKTLKLFNKKSSLAKNEEAIRRFHKKGFSLHGMFVLGSDEDTVETVRETVAFAKRMMLCSAQFFALLALPGTSMTAKYLKNGKVINKAWHQYDAHRVTIKPAKITPHILQEELNQANLDFYSWKEAARHLLYSEDKLYNAKLRILGNILTRKICHQMQPYCQELKMLTDWSEEVDGRYQSLCGKMAGMIQHQGREPIQTSPSGRTAVEDFVNWLPHSLESLPKEFLPYCQGVGSSKIEALRTMLNSEEFFSDSDTMID